MNVLYHVHDRYIDRAPAIVEAEEKFIPRGTVKFLLEHEHNFLEAKVPDVPVLFLRPLMF